MVMEKVVLVKVRFKSKDPEVVAVCDNVQTAQKYINSNKILDKYKGCDWHLSDREVLT